MSLYCTQPLQKKGGFSRKLDRDSSGKNQETDARVKGLVLDKIHDSEEFLGLSPNASAPQIVLELFSALGLPTLVEESPCGSADISNKKIPVGLRRCEPYGWINAVMQFLLHVPEAVKFFSFAPRSMEPFRKFIDQYAFDQRHHRTLSFADSASLVRCLLRRERLHRYTPRLFEVFYTIFSPEPPDVLHPNRMLLCNESTRFEATIIEKLSHAPEELIVAIEGEHTDSCLVIPRQLFSPLRNVYDLDLFIERRPDSPCAVSFIAYVKVEGSWIQCDDERIATLRSTQLGAPLHRSVLLHYKQIKL